jgi:uncharacterized protein (TIGR02421 family)
MAISERLTMLLREVSSEILETQKPLRVVRLLSWADDVERAFFQSGARELPRPKYQIPPEVTLAGERFQSLARRVPGDNEVERFLRDTCTAMATTARMLAAVGTKDFYFHSVELYGRSEGLSSDRRTTFLDLARHFDQVIAGYAPPPTEDDQPTLDAEQAAAHLQAQFDSLFREHPVRVSLVEQLTATASASADGIKIRRGSRFSPRELRQLACHEGQIHMATTLNGRAQPVLSFIGIPSPRTARTQEGLAVFTEFLERATSLPRLRRLCDRTLAIHRAEQGANFLDLYRCGLEQGLDERAAFDSARRVCRGGLVEGGAPFTKDLCYLDGLLGVTNFLRIALVRGQSQLVRMLFAGKIRVEDVPLMDRLAREGLVREPVYVPLWARDLSYLTAFISYTAFLSRSDLVAEERRFNDEVAGAEADLA